MTDRSITPPPELIEQWASESLATQNLCTSAAQWGADQELEACCEWLDYNCPSVGAHHLRNDRRPKPPSLKEINLKHLDVMERDGHYLPEILQDLRRAVEQLDD